MWVYELFFVKNSSYTHIKSLSHYALFYELLVKRCIEGLVVL
jgi:hypothetical protein